MIVSDLIKLSAKQAGILGVGQTLSGEDMQDCFNLLNLMLGELSGQRLSVYHLIDVSFTGTGATSYTIGPGGQINSQLPSRIEAAYSRNNGVDTPLSIIHAREDYDRIGLKSLQSFPQYVFLDTSYPLANLYVWPVPSSLYQITLSIMAELTAFNTVGDTINLPRPYQSFLMWALAVDICGAFGVEPPALAVARAKGTKNTLKRLNAQIPVARMPRDLIRNGQYNVYSDRVN